MNPYHKIRDFHGARAKAVGSSDIPILAGLMKRWGSTPYSLWEEKTGRKAPWSGNERTYWGQVLEGRILHRWVRDQFGSDAAESFYRHLVAGRSSGSFKVKTEARHPDFRFALAHADLVFDHTGDMAKIVEAKTAGFFGAKRSDDPDYGYSPDDLSKDGIPASVFLQTQWQLLCYGAPEATVAALIDTGDYREYEPIVSDKKVQEQELAMAQRFMWHVENDRPPQPQTWDDICALFPEPRQTTAMIAGEDEEKVRVMIGKKKQILKRQKRDKAELEDMRNAIGILIGENAVLSSAEGDVFAKSAMRPHRTIPVAEVEKKAPELYEKLDAAELIKKSKRREVRF